MHLTRRFLQYLIKERLGYLRPLPPPPPDDTIMRNAELRRITRLEHDLHRLMRARITAQ